MRKADILIAASLVLAAGASAIGVLTYQDTRGVANFEVTFTTRDVTLTLPTGSGAGGSEATLTFRVNLTNLTIVNLVVSISGGGARAQPGAVSVLVTPANGAAVEADGTIPAGPAGTLDIDVPVPLGTTPTGRTVRAGNAVGALAQVGAPSTNGTGDWNVTVALPAGTSPVPGLPGPLDPTYAITLTGTATTYTGEARPVLPEVSR